MTSDELFWVVVILAVPLLIFAAIEFAAIRRRRREKAIAQRPKARTGQRS